MKPTSTNHPRIDLLTLFIATVWLINGLYCKVLNGVPRHQEIVAEILGADFAPVLILFIGFAEIGMAIWVLSGWFRRWNALLQIALVLSMNVIEWTMAPDLLLWGKLNFVFALGFVGIVYHWAFGRS